MRWAGGFGGELEEKKLKDQIGGKKNKSQKESKV